MAVRDLPVRSATVSRDVPLHVCAARSPFLDYFRCPDQRTEIGTVDGLSDEEEYFEFGDAVCYGRHACARVSRSSSVPRADVWGDVAYESGRVCLPFDLSEVARNLRQERYSRTRGRVLERVTSAAAVHHAYYFMRPILAVGVRKHLQRIRFRGWETIPFPRWPVDFSVETLMQNVMTTLLRGEGVSEVPFIWFWPNGKRSCAVLTHDVEGQVGRDFCGALMDLDQSFGFTSAFQLVPHSGNGVWHKLADQIRGRGFEVNVHDLNHDGYLFHSRQEFDRRVADINRYVREFECRGFRSGSMYREQSWYDAFEFSYDMSVPNVAHLEPQRGGCCTVMPYFVGNILELPLTTTQDYSLFHILGDYSTRLWIQQLDQITAQHGLVTFLTHPDYLAEPRARQVYADLLTHLRRIRDEEQIWMALPAEVDRWWRNRAQMTLVRRGGTWRVEGPDSEWAQVAYAALDGDRVVYQLAR